MTADDDPDDIPNPDHPYAPNQRLAETLDRRSAARRKRQHHASLRTTEQSFADFNARRAERGLPPIEAPKPKEPKEARQ